VWQTAEPRSNAPKAELKDIEKKILIVINYKISGYLPLSLESALDDLFLSLFQNL